MRLELTSHIPAATCFQDRALIQPDDFLVECGIGNAEVGICYVIPHSAFAIPNLQAAGVGIEPTTS